MVRCIYDPPPPPPPPKLEMKGKVSAPPIPVDLLKLADEWEHRARCKFQSAQAQHDEAARRFIEHGATCYFNCAQQLRLALASALPLTSTIPSEAQT